MSECDWQLILITLAGCVGISALLCWITWEIGYRKGTKDEQERTARRFQRGGYR